MLYRHKWLRVGVVREEWLEEQKTKVSGPAASRYHEARTSGRLSGIETKNFAIFWLVFWILKIQITTGW